MSQRGCAGGRATNLPPAQPRDGQVPPGSSRAQHPSVQGCPDPVPVAPAAPALCIAAASCLHGSSTLIPGPSLPAQCPQGGRDPPVMPAGSLVELRHRSAPSGVPERMETRRGTGSCGINPRTCQPPRGHEPRQISALHCAKPSVAPLHLLGGGGEVKTCTALGAAAPSWGWQLATVWLGNWASLPAALMWVWGPRGCPGWWARGQRGVCMGLGMWGAHGGACTAACVWR